MTEHHDHDGDSIILTDDDKLQIEAEIAYIDGELANCGGSDIWRELNRQRRHLVDELAAGRRLPVLEEDEEA